MSDACRVYPGGPTSRSLVPGLWEELDGTLSVAPRVFVCSFLCLAWTVSEVVGCIRARCAILLAQHLCPPT